MTRPSVRTALLALILSASTTFGQDIVYRFGGQSLEAAIELHQTRAAGGDISINVGEVGGDVLLWIYDYTRDNGTITLPNQSVGKITISGFVTNNGTLRVLIAGPESSWPSVLPDNLSLASPGVVNLGLEASDGIEVIDTLGGTLRERTRLAAHTLDDIRGTIEIGQVQQIKAGYRQSGGVPNPGTIYAEITTIAPNGAVDLNSIAVGEVLAGNGIAGKIEAHVGGSFNPSDPTLEASIGRVAVGPAENALGIQGNILAETGQIGSILSSGPIIGTGLDPLKITAGRGIGEIRTTAGENQQTSVTADIVSAKIFEVAPESVFYVGPANDLVLRKLVVAGDLHGTVHAANVSGTGIVVDGICFAPIDIDLCVDDSNIVARTFTQPIHIGRGAIGAIVAAGGAIEPNNPPPGYQDGHIPSIVIGDLADAEIPAAAFDLYVGGLRGLVGTRGNVTAALREDDATWIPDAANSFAAIDACVRAVNHIGGAYLTSVTNWPGTGFTCGKFPPVIESPSIGSLVIEDFATGTVWSGREDVNDPESVYSQVDDIQIGCMRRFATLRVNEWASFDVAHHMLGDIHTPRMDGSSLITIGGIFGDDSAAAVAALGDELCLCSPNPAGQCVECITDFLNYSGTPGHAGERQYRNPAYPYFGQCVANDPPGTTADTRGNIWIHDSTGLAGQIIVNANAMNPAAIPVVTHWSGAVQIGVTGGGCPASELSPTAQPPDGSPYYDRLPSELGGGAVGLVPFALHDLACAPDNPPIGGTVPAVILQSMFWQTLPNPPANEPDRVRLEFYGPIAWDQETGPPVTITYRSRFGQLVEGTASYMNMFDFNIANAPGTNSPRILEIYKGANIGDMPIDVFTVTPNSNLLCDLGPSAPAVPVAPFTYQFRLVADCNNNGQSDAIDIAEDRTLDDGYDESNVPIGFPNNGVIDECDRVCAECPADYDDNGGIDGADVAAFFYDYEQGLECADVDGSGGIDGTDLAYFFTVYEAGGC